MCLKKAKRYFIDTSERCPEKATGIYSKWKESDPWGTAVSAFRGEIFCRMGIGNQDSKMGNHSLLSKTDNNSYYLFFFSLNLSFKAQLITK